MLPPNRRSSPSLGRSKSARKRPIVATLRQSGTRVEIKRAVEALGRSSEEFAARRMDASIKKALTGVSIEALEGDGRVG